MREYVVIIDDDVIFKKCQGLGMEWKQQDKERYGGSGVRGNGRKTWCEEIASAGIDLPSTNHLSCKTFNIY